MNLNLDLNQQFELKFKVTESLYSGFIENFQDKNPLHTSDSFAISKGFKSKVMHGNILNGFLSYFVGETLPSKNVIIHSQEIQFKNPVFLNDSLDFKAEVSGIYESVKAVEFKFKFLNSNLKVVAKGKIQIGEI
jgi:3-hydroxybutyryl-CoA dehydratase